MSDAVVAQDSFKIALKYLEELERLGTFSSKQESMLRLMCLDFLGHFSTWLETDEVAANAFKIYIQSTSVWGLLDVPESDWNTKLSKHIVQKTIVIGCT